mgnify:CR=1 FL=1
MQHVGPVGRVSLGPVGLTLQPAVPPAQRLLQEAEAYRDRVIADAGGEASRFDQIYEEYRKAPRVTRERMYLETMERVLGRTDKMILDQDSGAVPYLPLERTRRAPTPANTGDQ